MHAKVLRYMPIPARFEDSSIGFVEVRKRSKVLKVLRVFKVFREMDGGEGLLFLLERFRK
jgi:hypothetical protein